MNARRRIVTGMAMGLLALAAQTWAQSDPAPPAPPATQQSDRRSSQQSPFRTGSGERRYEGRGDSMRGGNSGGVRGAGNEEWRRGDARPDSPNFNEPSDDEWKEIEAFMAQHSPQRLARMKDIADDGRLRSVRNMATARYRNLQEVKDRDPKLYEIRLKRMKIEDDVFALSWDVKRADKPEKLRGEWRSKMREMVRNSLEERRYHLAKAADRLKESQKELQDDEKDERIEAAVDAKMKEMDDDRWPRDLRPPRRPREAEDVNAAPSEAKRQQQQQQD